MAKSFAFSADCKALEQAIKKVVSVTGPQSNFFLSAYQKNLCVFGLGADTFCMLAVPNATLESDSGIFGFEQERLVGLIKGRATMDFATNGNDCEFKQVKGRYSGKIRTLDVTDDQRQQIGNRLNDKANKGSKLSSDALAAIKFAVSATGVSDVYQNTTLLSFVVLKEGKLSVSSFDAQHFGLIRLKIKDDGSSFRAALPQTHFTTIEQLANGNDVQLSITNTGLRASGKGFVVCLPATQADESHFSMVPNFVKSLPQPLHKCKTTADKLLNIATNLFTLYSANATFEVKTKADVWSIELSTASGSASDQVKVKASGKDVKFSVDPRLLIDILNIAKACENLEVQITDKVIALLGKNGDGDVFLACSRVA